MAITAVIFYSLRTNRIEPTRSRVRQVNFQLAQLPDSTAPVVGKTAGLANQSGPLPPTALDQKEKSSRIDSPNWLIRLAIQDQTQR